MTKLNTATNIIFDSNSLSASCVTIQDAIDKTAISTKDVLDSLDKDDILEYAEKYCTKLARHLNGE